MSSAYESTLVLDHLGKLRLGRVAEQLDALLSAAARAEPTYLDVLDTILREEVGAKQRKRVAMGIQIAHFPTVKTLDDFDFKFQPSVDGGFGSDRLQELLEAASDWRHRRFARTPGETAYIPLPEDGHAPVNYP